jgi:hypothetical protein
MGQSRPTPGWLLTIITLLAATLDVFRLGVQPVWSDEALSIASCGLSSNDFPVHVISHEPFMVLYYVLLRLWLGFGQSEFAVRSLSVVFVAAVIPSLYALGQQFFSQRMF